MDTAQGGLAENDVSRLEAELSQTRTSLAAKLDEAWRRLQPGEFVERGVENMNNYLSESTGTLAKIIRDNPLPAAVAGAALAWLAAKAAREFGSSSSSSIQLPEGVKEHGKRVIQEVQKTVSSYAATAGQQASTAAQDVGDRANKISREVADRAQALSAQFTDACRATQKRVTDMYEQNPVAFSAITLLAGALLAFLPVKIGGSGRQEETPQYH